MNPSMTAGAISGVAGLLVFLILHHIWIMPIWFILPIGLVLALGGGIAVGWAYEGLSSIFPPFPWNIAALAGLIVVILLPALVLVHFRPPMFEMSGGTAKLIISTRQAAVIFILELLLTAALAGAAAGWLLGRTPQMALKTALAGVVFALGPGHNIPFISGDWPGVFRSWILLAAIILVSSVTLVLVEARLSGRM